MTEIRFLVSESARDVVRSVGVPVRSGPEFEPCPLNVGDLISYPAAPTLVFQVTRRWFRAAGDGKPAVWYLTLEIAGDPLAEAHLPAPLPP